MNQRNAGRKRHPQTPAEAVGPLRAADMLVAQVFTVGGGRFLSSTPVLPTSTVQNSHTPRGGLGGASGVLALSFTIKRPSYCADRALRRFRRTSS